MSGEITLGTGLWAAQGLLSKDPIERAKADHQWLRKRNIHLGPLASEAQDKLGGIAFAVRGETEGGKSVHLSYFLDIINQDPNALKEEMNWTDADVIQFEVGLEFFWGKIKKYGLMGQPSRWFRPKIKKDIQDRTEAVDARLKERAAEILDNLDPSTLDLLHVKDVKGYDTSQYSLWAGVRGLNDLAHPEQARLREQQESLQEFYGDSLVSEAGVGPAVTLAVYAASELMAAFVQGGSTVATTTGSPAPPSVSVPDLSAVSLRDTAEGLLHTLQPGPVEGSNASTFGDSWQQGGHPTQFAATMSDAGTIPPPVVGIEPDIHLDESTVDLLDLPNLVPPTLAEGQDIGVSGEPWWTGADIEMAPEPLGLPSATLTQGSLPPEGANTIDPEVGPASSEVGTPVNLLPNHRNPDGVLADASNEGVSDPSGLVSTASEAGLPLIDLSHQPTTDEFLVSYQVIPDQGVPIEKIAEKLAVESSTGTWTDVAASDPTAMAPFQPRVYEISNVEGDKWAVKIAYPPGLFEPGNLAQIWAAVGGDVFGLSGIQALRLKDISLSEEMLEAMPGPAFGVDGVREKTGIYDRPIIGSIFKPKFGMSMAAMKQMALDAYTGGLDQLKDDESMTSQSSIDFDTRIKAVLEAAEEAGPGKFYVANVTAPTYEETHRRASLVQELGGTHIMIDGLTAGLTTVASLRRDFPDLIIQVHRAGHAALTRPEDTGIDMEVLAKLFRAAGGDLIAVGTPPGIGKVPTKGNDVLRIEGATTGDGNLATAYDDLYHLPERWQDMPGSFAVVSGGLHPATVYQIISSGGPFDRVLQAGGGTHGHPDGTRAGATAILQAAEAALANIPLAEAAAEHEELRRALELWPAADQSKAPAVDPVPISQANGDTNDELVRSFVDGLQTYELSSREQVPGLVSNIVEDVTGESGLDVQALNNTGLHKGHTGAGVFLVKDAEGNLQYVAKVQPVNDGVKEYSGMTQLAALDLETFSVTTPVGVAKLLSADGTEHVVTIATGAKGKPLVELVEDVANAESLHGQAGALAHLQRALYTFADGLAELHDMGPRTGDTASTRGFERYYGYIDKTLDKLLASKVVPDVVETLGYSSEAELRARIQEVIDAAVANPGSGRFIHGDTNPGNEFFAEDGTATWIDTSTVPLGVNEQGQGIGHTGRDISSLGLFLEETVVEVGLTEYDAQQLRQLFEDRYWQSRQDGSLAEEGDALRFYEMRGALKALFHTPEISAAHETGDMTYSDLILHRIRMLGRAIGAPMSGP